MAEDPAEQWLRGLFLRFGATQCRGRSPVYETLSQELAGHPELLGLLGSAAPQQRRPSLLFAAVNLLLAAEPGAELAAYYPVHGGGRPVDGRLGPAFAAFCAEHRDQLGALLRERSTQTNEIRRCVALRLGLDYVGRAWPGPLALVEPGASAGLNLLVDRYRYQFGSGPATGAAVTITSRLRGERLASPFLGPVPEITSRLGLDQHPVDLGRPGDRAWLEAFIWPEQAGDLATLRAAVDLARSTALATVAAGDAVTDTAGLIAGLPGREPVVVFTASLLSYLAAGARQAFVAQLREAARHRPVAWVFAEGPGFMAMADLDLPALDGPLAQRNTLYLVGASLRAPGGHEDAILALADPYLRWLAPARHRADDFTWLPGEANAA